MDVASPLRVARRFLLQRTTVLALMLALSGAALFAMLSPPEPGRGDDLTLSHLVSLDGGGHLLTSAPFALLLAAFATSVLLSSWDQLGAAWRRTFTPEFPGEERPVVGASEAGLSRALAEAGYRPLRRAAGEAIWGRHAWGHWGNALLHAGLALALLSYLVYVLTERQGQLRLEEGDEVAAGTPWGAESRGLLAPPFPLPVGVRLERVTPTFREDDSLEALEARVVLVDRGVEDRHVVSPNASHYHLPFRVYQPAVMGHAFHLEARDGAGTATPLVLHLPLPRRRDVAGYGQLADPGVPALLKAKYLLSADRGSMDDRDPLLVLRLVDGAAVLAELPLRTGGSGRLGPLEVRLVEVRRWTTLLFDAGLGMTPVLAGFTLMILGALLVYAGVPRAVRIRRTADGHALSWRAFARDAAVFAAEREALLARCGAGWTA